MDIDTIEKTNQAFKDLRITMIDVGMKPVSKFETIKEWLHCLVSKKHAESTWLRIRPQDEAKALRYIKYGLITLFVCVAFTWGVAAGRYQQYLKLKGQYEQSMRGL